MAAAESYRRRADDASDERLRDLIGAAVREAMPAHACLSDAELAVFRKVMPAVGLLIERETQRAAFWRAVIDKTLVGLIWAGVIALGVVVREYAIAHGMWRQ